MSFKTGRLTALFSDAYAARDAGALLYKLLDAVGAELMVADEKVKALLKSHWVRHASGAALDGLGAIYGVERRTLRDGQLEPDEAFRRRLQSVVPLFTGGGTVRAVLGAVRSALGLPFDLDQLRIPDEFRALRDEIEGLITLLEFSPEPERVLGDTPAEVDGASELTLVFDIPAAAESRPTILWTVARGGGRRLSLRRLDSGAGVRSIDAFLLPEGATLRLAADADGRLSATIGDRDVSAAFVNLGGSEPTVLPPIPVARSEWRFRAQGGHFDLSAFDRGDSLDPPRFRVELSRIRLQRLTFDVQVPYFLERAIAELRERFHYPGELFVFQGLPPERIQEVVDQTRAAGVRGSVRFALNFLEAHDQAELFRIAGVHAAAEDHAAADALLAANVSAQTESHAIGERFAVGGIFDVSTFDRNYGYL